MKIYKILMLILGIILISLRVLLNNVLTIDGLTITIYFIMTIPIVAEYLKTAKLFGNEFTFRDSIEKIDDLIEKSADIVETTEFEVTDYPETFDLSVAKQVLEIDPILSLASLRIEIEKKIRLLGIIWLEDIDKIPLSKILSVLKNKIMLIDEQIDVILEIVKACNKAIHGNLVSYEEAYEIIELAQRVSNTLSGAYSINMMPNEEFKDQGYCCEFHHCIENMPFADSIDDKRSCPIFGHMCPGGVVFVQKCTDDGRTYYD